MSLQLDEFAKDRLLHYEPAGKDYMNNDYDEFWWREVVDGEGYIMVWSTGESFHTYRRPDEIHR